jgi:hypothetical protein
MGIVTASVNPNVPTTTQITNGDPGGEIVFPLATSPGGFFGATPVVKPSGPNQSALLQGQQAGIITTYGSTQSPSAVAANTAAEQSLTVQSGTVTATRTLIATGDVLFINKPTAQAGLGIGNVRVAGANSIGVNFNNATSGSITPTASQAYTVVAIRGLPTLSATLSPVAVAANTTAEQQFTVAGAVPGQLLQVTKPTAQAGLDIVGVRCVSNNVIGITFANFTATPITPTAAEVYTVTTLSGIDAISNFITLSLNAGTIGAIGAGLVVTGGNTTMTGALATDIPIGPPAQVTAQAVATNAAVPALSIIGADTLTMYFSGIGTGATPTAALTYDQLVYRLGAAAPLLLYNSALVPVSVAANTTAEQTFTVTGLVVGSAVWVNKPSFQPGLGIVGVRVSAANTLAITYANLTAAAIVPNAETYLVGNFQAKQGGAGTQVTQPCAAAQATISEMVAKTRTDLVALGLQAGA